MNVYIINKNGSLLYPSNNNSDIVYASLFFVISNISHEISPVPHSTGITEIESNNIFIYAYKSVTNITIMLTSLNKLNATNILHKIYRIYIDYALKNPFYDTDNVIKCTKFNEAIQLLCKI